MKENNPSEDRQDYPHNLNKDINKNVIMSSQDNAYHFDLHLRRNQSSGQNFYKIPKVKTIDRLAFHKNGDPRRWVIRKLKSGENYPKWLRRLYSKNDGSFKYRLKDHSAVERKASVNERLVARYISVDNIISIGYVNSKFDAEIDVIIPVYKGRDETMLCIYSVVSSEQLIKYNLIVVNDKSPDGVLCEELRMLSAAGVIDLHENKENLGFTGSCNYAMRLNASRDVILLNSDTEVYGNWIDRMVAAAERDPSIGTLTPISNNATIFSYPHPNQDNPYTLEISGPEIDIIASSMPKDIDMVETPTGMGYCLYIKRSALDIVGYFDSALFGKGYGEEVDLCLRISRIGLKNSALASVYVRHFGSVSFGSERNDKVENSSKIISSLYPNFDKDVQTFIANDNLRTARSYIDARRLEIARNKLGDKRILLITHAWGGGTEKHVKDLELALIRQGYEVFIARPKASGIGRFSVDIPVAVDCPSLLSLNDFSVTDDPEFFYNFLKILNVSHVHIHHMIGLGYCAPLFFKCFADRYKSIRLDFTLHDYLSVCARINLIDANGLACDGPSIKKCKKCTEGFHPGYAPMGFEGIYWPELYQGFLESCSMILAPDISVGNTVEKTHGEISIKIRPHWISPAAYEGTLNNSNDAQKEKGLNLGVLGAIGIQKGSRILRELAMYLDSSDLDIKIHIIGKTDIDHILEKYSCVEFHGIYDASSLVDKVSAANLDFMFFPGACPETFSYTLSETALMKIPPIAFDIGALSSRIKNSGFGFVLPLSLSENPRSIADKIIELKKSKDHSINHAAGNMNYTYEPSVDDYYDQSK